MITLDADSVVDDDGEKRVALAALRNGVADGVRQAGIALVGVVAKVVHQKASAPDGRRIRSHHGCQRRWRIRLTACI